MMNRRSLGHLALCAAAVASLGLPLAALAADEAPDAMIKRLSTDVLNTVKSDKAIQGGDLTKVIALVDKTVMPNVNFRRMTAAAVGPGWRQATPEQQKRLQDEFKILLVRTYAGALAQVNEQTIQVKPLRAAAEDKDVLWGFIRRYAPEASPEGNPGAHGGHAGTDAAIPSPHATPEQTHGRPHAGNWPPFPARCCRANRPRFRICRRRARGGWGSWLHGSTGDCAHSQRRTRAV